MQRPLGVELAPVTAEGKHVASLNVAAPGLGAVAPDADGPVQAAHRCWTDVVGSAKLNFMTGPLLGPRLSA